MQLGTSARHTLVTSLFCPGLCSFIPHRKASCLFHYITTIHHLFSIVVLIYHVIFLSSACSARFPFRHSFSFILHTSRSYQSFDQRFILVVMSPALDGRDHCSRVLVYYSIKLIIVECFFKELRFSAACCTKSCPPSLVLESSHILKNSFQLYFSEFSMKTSVIQLNLVKS